MPATKGKDGKIEECAEAYLSFLGGNRSFPVATVMDDRRYRLKELKPGENAQYDDVGQMTLMRRGFLAKACRMTAKTAGARQAERFVSLRHVEKKKQKRPTAKELEERETWSPERLEAQAQADKEERAKRYKHEGEQTVNDRSALHQEQGRRSGHRRQR